MESTLPSVPKPKQRSSIFEAYENFVWNHLEVVQLVEHASRLLFIIVPQSVRESDIQLEAGPLIFLLIFAAYAITGTLNFLNDLVIYKQLSKLQKKYEDLGENLPLALERQNISIAKWMTLIKNMEVLSEIFTRKYFGEDFRWRWILFVECMKYHQVLLICYQSVVKISIVDN